jgi:uracil-DNA glycosylase
MGATSGWKMFKRCSDHLSEEIRVLRPHLVITQGIKPGKTVLDLEGPSKPQLIRPFGKAGKARVLRGSKFIILITPHPAHQPGWKTKNGSLPRFLQNAVKCAADAISETC